MKKLMIILSLMLMMVASAFAVLNPTITNIGDTSTVAPGYFAEAACSYSSAVGKVFCMGMSDNKQGLYSIDVSTGVITLETTLSESGIDYTVQCEEYSGEMYCIHTYPARDNFKFNPTTFATTPLAVDDMGVDSACDLKPGTDEFYCWGGYTFNYPNHVPRIEKYDISEDSWTILKVQDWGDAQETVHEISCQFRPGTDEMWCVSGYSLGSSMTDKIHIYNTATNVSSFKSTSYVNMGSKCAWIDDVIYCYGGEYPTDPDELSDLIYYYDPTYDSEGFLPVTFPEKQAIYFAGAQIDGNTAITVGGYQTDAWDYPPHPIYKLEWTTSVDCEDGNDCLEPSSIEKLGDTTAAGDRECLYADDEIYCFDFGEWYYYNPDTVDLEHVSSFPAATAPILQDRGYCWYESDETKLYCLNFRSQCTQEDVNFKMNLDGTGVEFLGMDFCQGGDSGVNSLETEAMDCDNRPGTDQVWCYMHTATPPDGTVWYYDVSDDAMYKVATGIRTNDDEYGVFEWPSCRFRNDDEFYCLGGYGDSDTTKYIMKYVISTNTSEFIDWGYSTAGSGAYFIGDVLYTFGKEDYWLADGTDDTIAYYDPDTGDFGILATTLPEPRSWHGAVYKDGVMTMIGGQGVSFAAQTEVYEITWDSLACTPSWECSEYSDQCINFEAECVGVTDRNACGQSYTGNYSEFEPELCGVSSGSTGAAHQQIITPKQTEESEDGAPAFSIVGGEKFNLWEFIDSIIFWIREKVGLQ